jgi:hypothetical protein
MLYNSHQHALSLLSLLYLHQLLSGNGFQRRSFLSFRVYVLTGRQLSQLTPRLAAISHQLPIVLTAVSRFSRNRSCSSLYSIGTERKENTSSNNSIVASRIYPTDRVENTASQLLHCCVLRICCLTTGVFPKPFPSNGGLCWLHSSCLEQICHIIHNA